jgi:hypothetical protein
MARRGALTALQAVLAGVSGGAQGYIQQRELERKREQEKAQQERQTLMDTISLFEKGAFEAGPIATRAPSAPPQARAAAGEEVKAPRPSMSAIPLAGVSPEAMQQAEAGLSRYETGGPGAMPIEIGGRRLVLPSAATRRAEEAADRFSEAFRRADMERTMAKGEADTANRQNYETWKEIYGKRGTYNPNLNYATAINAAETERGRASAQAIAQIRATPSAGTGAGTGGRTDARGPLPSVMSTIDRLSKMTNEQVLSLRPGRIAMAAEAPLMMSEAGGTMKIPALIGAAGMNWMADPEEQEYANMIGAVGDAVARAAERGVLTNQDIARYRAQVQPLANDSEETQLRKFQTLKAWAQWLSGNNEMVRLPGETIDDFDRRTSMLRQR